MGLFDKLKKKVSKPEVTVSTKIHRAPLPDWANHDPVKTDSSYTVKSFEPANIGGFDLVNLPVSETRWVNTITGEVESTDERVLLTDTNILNAIKALQSLAPIADETTDHVDNWVDLNRWIPDLIKAVADHHSNSLSYDGYMFVDPLTPTGKPKKYPINLILNIDFAYPFKIQYKSNHKEEPWTSATCNLYFTQDGIIGKGSISYHGNGYGVSSDVDTYKGNQFLKRVRVIVPPSTEWMKVYPTT